ncbi:MAG: histidinol-phosphate aminotransferase family protein [Anaerolineae bacterium]|nr:histidinol-phosphate aminotransferase family protein [Anaerolineae bacterium]
MNIVKLDMNEMPYTPPLPVIEAAQRGLVDLNRYADACHLQQLLELVAGYAGVPEHNIVLSPGSDLLLREVIHAFSWDRQVLTVSPSFLPTVQIADRFAHKRLRLRLSPPDFRLDPDLLLRALKPSTLVIIDNPNNPTGQILLDCDLVASLAKRQETLIVVDEAYFEFSGVTCAPLVTDNPNLCVVRTLDKAFGLAGARVGYAVAGEHFVAALSTPLAYLPQPSLRAAMEALRNPDYMRGYVRQIAEERAWLVKALRASGATVYPSHANFLLVKAQLPDMARRLRELNVWVSDMATQLPAGYIRVSVGTPEENRIFMTRYKQLTDEAHYEEDER